MEILSVDLGIDVVKKEDARYYSVRPEWVWSKKNKGLTKVASLKITLGHPDVDYIKNAFNAWLTEVRATEDKADCYYMGGCGAVIEQKGNNEWIIILSSGGQDALESLDYYTEWLYTSVIEKNKDVTVTWEELPLH